MRCVGKSGSVPRLDLSEELRRRHDGDSKRLFQIEQVAILGNHVSGSRSHRTRQNGVIFGVAAALAAQGSGFYDPAFGSQPTNCTRWIDVRKARAKTLGAVNVFGEQCRSYGCAELS